MSLLDQGCQCEKCREITKLELIEAREGWLSGNREIVFKPYHRECGDGCCDDYGTDVYVNGFNLNCDGSSAECVVEALMEFLEFDNVVIEFEDE